MAAIDNLRNSIIDKLLTISNKQYLSALYQIIESGESANASVLLTDEQKLMLQLSDDDIANNRLIKQDDLDKQDIAWLKTL